MPEAKKPDGKGKANPAGGKAARDPDWARGLKRLYDSVVDEPLPDSFKDLLGRLDDSKK